MRGEGVRECCYNRKSLPRDGDGEVKKVRGMMSRGSKTYFLGFAMLSLYSIKIKLLLLRMHLEIFSLKKQLLLTVPSFFSRSSILF